LLQAWICPIRNMMGQKDYGQRIIMMMLICNMEE